MKKQTRTIIIVLLNVLFCAYMLWFFARNTYLRPYAGSTTRELLAGLILLITLYANYFLLYPKLHKKHPLVLLGGIGQPLYHSRSNRLCNRLSPYYVLQWCDNWRNRSFPFFFPLF